MTIYEPVIGLEVHLQTKTNSKMFCGCHSDYFGAEPNTHTCPVCLGLPGALPVPNEKAIEQALKLSLALNCSINKKSKFDRKNYFFYDLPKGYQISQYDLPIGYDGWVEIEVRDDSKRIRITRVHQEEDTAKTITEGEKLLVDFNKSGVPLVEIVTKTDFESIEEVIKFSKRVRQIVRYLDISDADMEKGQMRFELNMSMKEKGQKGLPKYKVEIKNIGSISVLEKVIEKEMARQIKILESGKMPEQETRGLKDMTGETVSQRVKEGSEDYRYFPEPDIPPLEFGGKEIEEIRKSLPELPHEKKMRFEKEYGIDSQVAEVLISTQEFADWYEKAAKGKKKEEAIDIASRIVGDLKKLMTAKKVGLKDLKIKPEHIGKISEMVSSGTISGTTGKQVLEESFETGKGPEEIVREKNLGQIGSSEEIQKVAKKVVENNSKVVDDYKNKNENALKYLVGQVMRETKGRANPKLAEEILKNLLK